MAERKEVLEKERAAAAKIKAFVDKKAAKIKAEKESQVRQPVIEFLNTCAIDDIITSQEKEKIVKNFVSNRATSIQSIKTLTLDDLKKDLGVPLFAAKAIFKKIQELNGENTSINTGDALASTVDPTSVTSFGASGGNEVTAFGSLNKPDVAIIKEQDEE
jgi:hypothetical protein